MCYVFLETAFRELKSGRAPHLYLIRPSIIATFSSIFYLLSIWLVFETTRLLVTWSYYFIHRGRKELRLFSCLLFLLPTISILMAIKLQYLRLSQLANVFNSTTPQGNNLRSPAWAILKTQACLIRANSGFGLYKQPNHVFHVQRAGLKEANDDKSF